MRFFANVSKKTKRDLILRLLFIVLAGTLLLFCAFITYGWFSSASSVRSSGLQISVSTEKYDILVERTTEYDDDYNYVVGSGELKDLLAAADYDLTHSSTSDASCLAYEMINEYVDDGKRYLMPGSYGTVVFYLRPKDERANVIAEFDLSLAAYVVVYDELGNSSMETVVSENVLNMLKGHILFFTGRTGAEPEDYKYSGLVIDSFTYDTSEHSKCAEVGKTDCYKIVLYWEWPITYYDISQNISTTSPEVVKKYPAEVWNYLTLHNDYFFAVVPESGKQESYSDAYNDGDQMIGDGTNCIVLRIEAK